MFRRWYYLEADFVLTWTSHFHPHFFPRHDHVFTLCYTDYFTANMAEMLTHARAKGTRPLFPLPFAAWVRGYCSVMASCHFATCTMAKEVVQPLRLRIRLNHHLLGPPLSPSDTQDIVKDSTLRYLLTFRFCYQLKIMIVQ